MDSPALVYRTAGWLYPVGVAICLLGALGGLVATLVNGGPVVMMIVFVAMGAASEAGVLRSAYLVSCENGYLTWRGYLHTVKVPLRDVTRLTLNRTGTAQVIQLDDGRKLWVPTSILQ